MARKFKNIYQYWKDSSLAQNISDPSKQLNLDEIWNKANQAYPRAVWPGWVDHGPTHIFSVLRNLDRITPSHVYTDIGEAEAFVLIAAVLLHDIGMIPVQGKGRSLKYLASLRQRHGCEGVEIIRKEFRDFLRPDGEILEPVCEIVKNHHGTFKPKPILGLDYDLSADALWVRLADELDFGPHRAPTWLLDYIRPSKDQIDHWRTHNQIHEPMIDIELLRIQVWGTVENEAFIRKLRSEFESAQARNLQASFLSRGLTRRAYNRTFLIWDCTELKAPAGEDSKEVDARPAVFSNDQFLLAGRHLYNLGKYKAALECFQRGLDKLGENWSAVLARPYFYHYLKTLNALGKHKESIKITEHYTNANFSPEIKAAIATSNGLAYWKMGNFTKARDSLKTARDKYEKLSRRDIKHKLNQADAWVLLAATYLEEIRAAKDSRNDHKIEDIRVALKNAENLFSEYAQENPRIPESHYKGRYWGLKAFFELLQIKLHGKRKVEAWNNALQFAKHAYGGKAEVHRNPFGAMCGKYCAAAVNYHKYENCDNNASKRQSLVNSARLVTDVLKKYDSLFGLEKKIFRLWPRIDRLSALVQGALPQKSKARRELTGYYSAGKPVKEVEIYTPLH